MLYSALLDQTFVWGHPFSTYLSYDGFFNPQLSLVGICTHLEWPPFCVRNFIDLILSSPILTLLVFHSFLILFYPRHSRIDVLVSDTHHFLASHSVSSSLAWKVFSLMVTSNCLLFYLLWPLTKLSYANANESYSRRTARVIVTVYTKVLSFSQETATAITLCNSNNKITIV